MRQVILSIYLLIMISNDDNTASGQFLSKDLNQFDFGYNNDLQPAPGPSPYDGGGSGGSNSNGGGGVSNNNDGSIPNN